MPRIVLTFGILGIALFSGGSALAQCGYGGGYGGGFGGYSGSGGYWGSGGYRSGAYDGSSGSCYSRPSYAYAVPPVTSYSPPSDYPASAPKCKCQDAGPVQPVLPRRDDLPPEPRGEELPPSHSRQQPAAPTGAIDSRAPRAPGLLTIRGKSGCAACAHGVRPTNAPGELGLAVESSDGNVYIIEDAHLSHPDLYARRFEQLPVEISGEVVRRQGKFTWLTPSTIRAVN